MNKLRVLLVDNYDSFTYNLVHYFEQLELAVTVVKNDELDLSSVKNYDAICLSPGPGLPKEKVNLMELIQENYDRKPILGVCLGMQALCEFFGGKLMNQPIVNHGISIKITTEKCKLYKGLQENFSVGLYHSWKCSISNVATLIPTAFSSEKVLMSFEHKTLPLVGIQYHPESIMTPNGMKILKNFFENYP